METAPLARLDRIAAKYARRPDTSEVRFAVASASGGWEWGWAEEGSREPFFLASATKLLTTAVVMQLRQQGALSLGDPAARHLPAGALEGLHVLEGEDRSDQITVGQLLGHTSGIPDYFEGRRADGTTLMGELLAGDRGWTAAEALEMARGMRPAFAPGTPGRALYSDTNFQVLQMVVEALEGRSYADSVAARIAAPLGLARTWILSPSDVAAADRVAGFLHGRDPLHIPRAMASFQADGGAVSTAPEALRFLRAFFEGDLFPRGDLPLLTGEWRRIFFPLQYGAGVMRFAPPWLMTLRRVPEMIGHSGASGAVAFHVPELGLYVTGSVNQARNRSLAYRALMEIVLACR